MTLTPETFCIGCVPIVDNERTNAYVRWAQGDGRFPAACCTQADLGFCPLDSPLVPYSNPIDDEVCWFDPDIPESADFLGLWIVGLDGMEDDNFTRSTNDVGGRGTVFNRPMQMGKTLTFDVMLLASSCCGMDYGYNWLVNVLKGQGCAHGSDRFTNQCGTSEIKVRVCCPEPGEADTGLRFFPSAALTDGVKRADGDRRDRCCCNYRRYTFVIQTGTNNSFSDLVQICEEEVDEDPNNAVCRDKDFCVEVVEPVPCVDPTGCGDLFVDAFASPSLRDDCYCPAWSLTRTCCCLDEFQVGSTTRALVIDLFAGADPFNPRHLNLGTRNVEVLIFENPMKLPCPTTQEEFEIFRDTRPVCARVTVGYISSGSTLRIDGRTGEAYIVCAGQKLPVYDGVEGDLQKLETGCNPLLVCALWDAQNLVLGPETTDVKPSKMTVSVARKFG